MKAQCPTCFGSPYSLGVGMPSMTSCSHLRVLSQGTGDGHTLLLPPRQCVCRALAKGLHAHQLQGVQSLSQRKLLGQVIPSSRHLVR